MKWLKYLLAFLLLAGPACGATVYINNTPDGVYYESGASSCTDVTEDDTSGDLQDAIIAASTDGTVYVCSSLSGTEIDSDYVASPQAGQSLIGVGNVTLNGDGNGNHVFYVSVNDWTIQNISVTGAIQNGITIEGARTGWTIDNVTSYGNLVSGIRVDGNDGTVTGTIENTTTYGNGTNTATSHGIMITECPGATILIKDSTSYNNGVFAGETDGRGITVSEDSSGVTIQGCYLYNNGSNGDGTGLEIYGSDVAAYRLMIYGNADAIEAKGSTTEAASLGLYYSVLLGSLITGEYPEDGSGLECTLSAINNTIIADENIAVDVMSPSYVLQNNIIASEYSGAARLIRFGNMSNADIESGTMENNCFYYPNASLFVTHRPDLQSTTTTNYASVTAFNTAYSDTAVNCLDDTNAQLNSSYLPGNADVLYGGTYIAALHGTSTGQSDYDGTHVSPSGPIPIGAQGIVRTGSVGIFEGDLDGGVRLAYVAPAGAGIDYDGAWAVYTDAWSAYTTTWE